MTVNSILNEMATILISLRDDNHLTEDQRANRKRLFEQYRRALDGLGSPHADDLAAVTLWAAPVVSGDGTTAEAAIFLTRWFPGHDTAVFGLGRGSDGELRFRVLLTVDGLAYGTETAWRSFNAADAGLAIGQLEGVLFARKRLQKECVEQQTRIHAMKNTFANEPGYVDGEREKLGVLQSALANISLFGWNLVESRSL